MRESQIRSLARRILKENEDIFTIPVNILAICKRYARIEEYEVPGVNGLTIKPKNSGKPIIIISPHSSPLRQRFTLAHELGHLILKHNSNGRSLLQLFMRTPDPLLQRFDREADIFASEILLPLPHFRNYAVQYDYNVEILSDIFCVSVSAVRIRLNEVFGESYMSSCVPVK